jgi:hypothetical protein
MKTTLTLLLCSLSLLGWGQKKETLAFNLEKGATYSQTVESSIAVAQQMMGQSIRLDMTTRVEMDFLVKEASATRYDLEASYKSFRVNVTSPMGAQAFDSGNAEASSVLAKLLTALKEKPVQLKMSKQGKIIEASNFDDVLASVTAQSPQDEMMLTQLKSMIGGDALKQSFENSTAYFPDHPVAKGESWTQEVEQSIGMPIKIAATYTFLGSENGLWKIAYTATVATPDKESYTKINGVDMKTDLQGNASGEFKLDKKSGWTTEGNMTMTMKGNAHVKVEQLPDGISVDMEIETSARITGKVSK